MTRETFDKNKILVVIGSASKHSSNRKLMEVFQLLPSAADFKVTIMDELETLPHFDPKQVDPAPVTVMAVLNRIQFADGIVICTPEYIFGIPARLKNLLEWCVATTIFDNKPVGLITASADGVQGHAQLRLIMQTLGARLSDQSELLVKGVKGKFNNDGEISDPALLEALDQFVSGFKALLVHTPLAER